MTKPPPELDRIADVVLAYKATPLKKKSKKKKDKKKEDKGKD